MKFHEQLVLFVVTAVVCFLTLDRLQSFAKSEQARIAQAKEVAAKSAYDEAYAQGKYDALLSERQSVWREVSNLKPCQSYTVYDPDAHLLRFANSIVFKRTSCNSKGVNAK